MRAAHRRRLLEMTVGWGGRDFSSSSPPLPYLLLLPPPSAIPFPPVFSPSLVPAVTPKIQLGVLGSAGNLSQRVQA